MATNIDKSVYQAPQGLAGLESEPVEVEVLGPEEDMEEEPEEEGEGFNGNLAEELDESVLQRIGSDLAASVDTDRQSRKEWEKTYVMGLKLMGLQYEERTEPWMGASGVFHPMITEAVVRFQSETITEMFPAQGPVRTTIWGKETPEKMQAARNVEEDMNYELVEKMPEFRPEQERMLWSLPATGSAFKKVYKDPTLGRQKSVFIPAEDVILPYGCTDIRTCERVTHEMRMTKNEILKLMATGFYRNVELGDPSRTTDDIQKAKDQETGFTDNSDDRYTLFESLVDLDLDGFNDVDEDNDETGIALPYVMTIVKGTNQVLSIRRNWKENDPLKLKRQHFVHYQYVPGFGAYGFGLFHLIGGFAKSATSIMRQLVDAGTLSNLPGGLKSRGLRIKGDDTPIAPGEFRDVDIGSGALRDNILPLPYKEPSQVLYTLLNNIVDEGRRFAATADMQVSDMSSQAPVGTTLALLERQLKVMTAVQARVHYAFKQELQLLAEIIREDSPDEYEFDPEKGSRKSKKADFSHVDIIPVSDPNAATMSQRVVQYQAVIQMAQMSPDIYNLPELHRRMLEVLGIKNPDKLVPLPDDQTPKDPISENVNAMNGVPLKAFQFQDHQAHIQVHMAAMQDPQIQQLMGQNPKAPMIMAAMQAHLAEHAGFEYRKQVEAQLGMALPQQDEKLPPEAEVAMSGLMAQAAQRVLQQHQQQAQQQQNQQNQQDPIIQLQQQEMQLKQAELQLRQQEVQIKAQQAQAQAAIEQARLQANTQMHAQKLALEQQKVGGTLQAQTAIESQKIKANAMAAAQKAALEKQKLYGNLQLGAMKVGAEVKRNKLQADSENQREGLRIGADIAKHKAEQRSAERELMLKTANEMIKNHMANVIVEKGPKESE
jgi:hypothetical protein